MSVSPNDKAENRVVIIGGGPAGLTAAYELMKHDQLAVVLEKADKVGGLSRTENYKGFYFDMGGHRFFTKSKVVNIMWHEILGDDLLVRPRLSRIYYNNKYFNYPLKPLNALAGLGIRQTLLILLSYLRWQFFPYKKEETFEQWVTNRFGKRLFLTFFKSYTEKVWGISTSELRAEWAAQRIMNLSLSTAVIGMFLKRGDTVKSLIEEFHYPRLGPGMMWNAVKDKFEQAGGEVRLNHEVVEINRNGKRIKSVVVSCNGKREVIHGADFITSIPVSELIKRLDPPPPQSVFEAADKLRYRDFLTVCLIVKKESLFPDNWIYIHDPDVKVGRIQNFKNWSPHMVPDPRMTSLGLEYFCNSGDGLWNMADAELIELGKSELEQIGLANRADIEDGCVFRVSHSYPVYDSDYREYLSSVRGYIDSFENLQTIGRNGLHRYNNQDHAMLTGMLATRNLVLGENSDLWSVNTDQEYHEEIHTKPTLSKEAVREAVREIFAEGFTRLDPTAFGLSVGIGAGLVIFLATIILVLRSGEIVGPRLQLLEQFLPGYAVTPLGSIIGMLYGFIGGFSVGWGGAFLRNAMVLISMASLRLRAEWKLLRKLLDYI